jgi:hypothetical protein
VIAKHDAAIISDEVTHVRFPLPRSA